MSALDRPMAIALAESFDETQRVELLTVSALWHSLPDGYDVCINAGLCEAEQFSDESLRPVFLALMACGLHGFKPTERELRSVIWAGFVGEWPDLDAVSNATTSGACLSSWSRLVVVAARRRQQVSRLSRALTERIVDPFADRGGIDHVAI